MIEDAINTAQSISNFGMLAVTAGFFLVLSAVLMVTCFKWFMRVINNTMDNQKKAMEELVTETKSQNEKLDDIAEGRKRSGFSVIIQKVYTTNGWQVVGSPSSSNSLYGEYVANSGSKTKEEFNGALFNLIV